MNDTQSINWEEERNRQILGDLYLIMRSTYGVDFEKDIYDYVLRRLASERERWEAEFLNQKANQHDQKVRQQFLKEIQALLVE